MNASSKTTSAAWLVVLLAAGVFLAWINHVRIQRVEYVTSLAQPSGRPVRAEKTSTTNGAPVQRELIVPERNEGSFGLIAQTQQMLATGRWRIRQVDYDNAPSGREVRATSPYRWWLGLAAWMDHAITGRPVSQSVEHAALYADPILHGLLLLIATIFVAWQFGSFSAALFAVGLTTLFPFAVGFLPGVPDHHGLARICGIAEILLLLAGVRSGRSGSRWFALAGISGGLGVWLDVSTAMSVAAGAVSGGMLAIWLGRRHTTGESTGASVAAAWRHWSFAGAASILTAYLLEYYPAQLGEWHPEVIHPVYGLIWIAAGELLARMTTWAKQPNLSGKKLDYFIVLLAIALAAVPVAISWSGTRWFLPRDLVALRLTNQPDGIVATNFWSWLIRDSSSVAVWTTLLSAVAILPAAWYMLRAGRQLAFRFSLAIALMPGLVALGIACGQLAWWSMFGGMLLVLIVAATSERMPARPRIDRWIWAAVVALIGLSGIFQLLPSTPVNAAMKLTSAEAQELIERDLAHWLVQHANEPRPVVYAPPRETQTLCFYGGLRGIGTFDAENSAGFGTALMIAGAQTMEEVETQVRARGISYIVIPSWDPFFDEFGRLYLNQAYSNRKSLLVSELRRWNLPLWLRPVAYPMPVIGGLEQQSVFVFEVVDPQNPAVAAARLAEYLVETGATDQTASIIEALRRYPGDLGAMAARAQVLDAKGDANGFAQTVDLLASRVADGADRFLPWDRRVSLAVVLAQGNRLDPARAQVRRCLTELDERKLRSLSPGSLYKLVVLSRAFEIEITDVKLRTLALELLPADLRDKI